MLSIFGAMFAPRPFEMAKEMVRVTRPGGRIVMGNWIPGAGVSTEQISFARDAFTFNYPDTPTALMNEFRMITDQP